MKKETQSEKTAMYQKPVILNATAHKNLKFTPVTTFEFAKGMTSAALLAPEFIQAAKDMPIVFAKTGEKTWDALAVMSITNGENVFVAEDGTWNGQYIPAVFRRYPFILSSDEKAENFSVCFDELSKCFSETTGEALFDEKGEQTKTMQNILKFLQDFQNHYQLTQNFLNKLEEMKLLREMQSTFTINKEKQYALNGMWVVDEEKLNKLDDKSLLELTKSGMMAWIHFHLMSLSNLGNVANKFATAHKTAA